MYAKETASFLGFIKEGNPFVATIDEENKPRIFMFDGGELKINIGVVGDEAVIQRH